VGKQIADLSHFLHVVEGQLILRGHVSHRPHERFNLAHGHLSCSSPPLLGTHFRVVEYLDRAAQIEVEVTELHDDRADEREIVLGGSGPRDRYVALHRVENVHQDAHTRISGARKVRFPAAVANCDAPIRVVPFPGMGHQARFRAGMAENRAGLPAAPCWPRIRLY
jgi:hypothetical protein